MNTQQALYTYLLRLGDSALIQGHRLSEWCSRGPILEEDLALTNLALDHIGRAQALLKYAGEVEGQGRSEDDLAYRRGERAFLNPLITELPNGDFAFTMARMLLVAAFEYPLYNTLIQSADTTLAGIAAKAVKEVRYHLIHAQDWCYRLGKGTELSHQKLQAAFDELWMFTGELFEMDQVDEVLFSSDIAADLHTVREVWRKTVMETLQQATIREPQADYMQSGSRQGIHTEYLGHILTEMQYLQRAYPDATW